ncbi:MAG: TIGR04255 family protein [Hyphomicrobium sp.]
MYQTLPSPTYPRAPIIEAVIQFRVMADVELRLQEKVAKKLKTGYPHSQPLKAIEVTLDNTGGRVGVSQNSEGYRLASDDQTEVVIINSRGITAARLAPYTGWPNLRARAEAAWQAWREVTPAHAIERIGVRMINRIDIPAKPEPIWQLHEYLRLFPAIPTLTDAPMSNYMVQVSIPTFDPLWMATLTSTVFQPPPVPGHNSVLLDIDVARTSNIPLNNAQLWPVVDLARTIKNDLFERCITDATRELFA